LNIVLIAALLASPWLPVGPAHALAWGVAVAGVAQLAFLARAAARADMWPTFSRPRWNPRVKRLALLVLPGALGAGVAQVNMLVDLWFASHLPPGAQSYLFYADRLNQLPLGVVGIAVGTALLPVLSREVAAGDAGRARGTLNRAIQLALLLTLPATAALVLIAEPIVVALFERGAFDAEASRATAATVQAFAVGLPAYVLVKIMAPAFFAREDTRTPVAIAAIAVVANVALILVFIDAFAHVGIALATALANWLNVTLLALLLGRAGWFRPDRALASNVARALAATLVMAAVLVAVDRLAADWTSLLRLVALVGAGGAGFAVAALALGAIPEELRRLVARNATG
jgi:putative peptidoglycan lipid II flippase